MKSAFLLATDIIENQNNVKALQHKQNYSVYVDIWLTS